MRLFTEILEQPARLALRRERCHEGQQGHHIGLLVPRIGGSRTEDVDDARLAFVVHIDVPGRQRAVAVAALDRVTHRIRDPVEHID